MCKWFGLLLCLVLISCGSRDIPAPVAEVRSSPINLPSYGHKVRRGETLYAIAFLYDVDYKQLARINNIRPPYRLAVGQLIKFRVTNNNHYTRPYVRPYIKPVKHYNAPPQKTYYQKTYWQKSGKWMWPVKGTVKTSFAPFLSRKGIDISGKKGDKIYAAQSGVVAYAGSGLSNYGNLIIIKHPNNYLTAYGNNARNLVREGQYVNSGQVIAEMGIVNHQFYGLHFEIRQRGKPLNPLLFLKR